MTEDFNEIYMRNWWRYHSSGRFQPISGWYPLVSALYINNDFLLTQYSSGTLKLRNFANTDYKYLRLKGIELIDRWALRVNGDSVKVGDDIHRTLGIPSFTSAQWETLTLANGFVGYDTDIKRFICHHNETKILEEIDASITTFADEGATASVSEINDINIQNTNPQTMTDFTNSHHMQIIRIKFSDNNTTIPHAGVGNFRLTGGININFATDDMLVLQMRNDVWYQIGGRI